MNIAILVPTLGAGGAERIAQILGDYYTDMGNKVYYFLADTDVNQDYKVKGEIIQTGIKSCMDGYPRKTQMLGKLFCSSFKMRRFKRYYNIDVAISFMEEFNYLNILSKGKEKVIISVHAILSQCDELKGGLYDKYIIKFFYSIVNQIVVVSRYAREDMNRYYGISLKKMIVIPNPAYKMNEIEDIDDARLWEFGKKVIVCVGRLVPVKQHEKIIRAFSYICQNEPDAKLVILGVGPQLNYLRKISENCGVKENVVFEGLVKNVWFYLKNARVFVMASQSEGFPNSMMEAMYYGVPVITTDSPGGCGEIVGKPKGVGEIGTIVYCKYGIMTPYIPYQKVKSSTPLFEQEKLLGMAMQKLLDEDELYEKYRIKSFQRARMYSLEKIMAMWDNIIKNG